MDTPNLTSKITWHDADTTQPDDEALVLLADSDGEVHAGFMDAGNWYYDSGGSCVDPITHWAEFPAHPTI